MNSTSTSPSPSFPSHPPGKSAQAALQSSVALPSTPPSSHELLSSPETPLPPATPTHSVPSSGLSRSKSSSHPLQHLSSMANDPSVDSHGHRQTIGLGFGEPRSVGFDRASREGGEGREGARSHHPSAREGAPSRSSVQHPAASGVPSEISPSQQAPPTSSTRPNGQQLKAGDAAELSSSSSTFPPPSSSSAPTVPAHSTTFAIASSSTSKPAPSSSSSTFIIRPTPIPIANEGDDPMRSPSPSPQRPETSASLVPSTGEDSDEDAVGEDEEEEPLGVPTAEEIDKLEDKVRELTLEFGLSEDEEVGDDESKEMRGMRAMRDLIVPLLPALHLLPTLQAQVLSQSETITSLRRVLTIQAELAQRASEESRAIQEVERAGWESSLNVLLEKAREAHSKEMAVQQEKLAQYKPKGFTSGPSTSKKETGFDKIETVDTDDYDKLIKKWLELQAENRKAGVEKTTMMYKIRDSETQINALTEELHFLRASALHGSRSAPQPLPSRSQRTLPLFGPVDDVLPPPARRQTLGDARAEHLLLAAKRLRTLRVTNPDIGLIRTGDYGLAGMDVPEDVKILGSGLSRASAPGATSSSMVIGSSANGGFDSSGVDGDGDEDMASSTMGTVGGRTPKPKAVRAKSKKAAVAAPGHPTVASSVPIPRTPKGKSPSKKKAGGTPAVGEQTPGGTAIPGASFDDLLMAAGVFSSRPTTSTKVGVSATRGSANADEGEEELDELESEEDPSSLSESPKRRKVQGGAASSWVPGQTLTSGHHPQYQQQPVPGPSAPRNPLNTSTGSEGTMHATALDLLALASSDPTPTQPVASSSSARLGGVMASAQPTPSRNGFGGGLVSLDAPFVLRSSPEPSPHVHSSPSFYHAQATPLRPQHLHHAGQYQPDDVFSPSTPGSSVPSRVKDFSLDGQGANGRGESPFGSPSGQVASSPAGSGTPSTATAIQTANAANNMPARRVRSPYLKWSNEEDELLARGVAKYGQKWDLVSKAVPTRSYHQCRQRWLRKLGVFDHKPALPASTSNAATIFGGQAETI